MRVDEPTGEKRTRLEALWFYAEAWEETRRFFHNVVGLREAHVNDAEGWAQFSTDAGPAIHVMRGGLPGQPRGVPVVGLRFPELESLHERLRGAGVEVEVRRGDAGITRLRFSDLEGHRFAAYRWELKDAVKPITVRGMATDDRERVLVVRVGREWNLPGGVVDENEGLLEALEREFLEEVSVRPVDPQLAGVYFVPTSRSGEWDGLVLFFHCRAEGEPRPSAEVEACEFVDISRLRELVTPWMLDRVLDALEFPGRAVVRTQRTASLAQYISPRSPRK